MGETKLNTNPEILLRKRRNADRIRLEKQAAARARAEERKQKAKQNKNKFIRVESILAKKMGTQKEQKRVGRVSKALSAQKLKLVLDSGAWDEKPKLLLVIRVKSDVNGKVAAKPKQVLQAMRLSRPNEATFIKLTPTVLPLLKLVAPYVVVGTPSLVTVRELILKRGKVAIKDAEGEKEALLDDNTLIEERLEQYGMICTEDLVHEIFTLGENFKHAVAFLKPFNLAPPVTGWGPVAKLKRAIMAEEKTAVSQSGESPLMEIDVDKYVANQN